jgi:signal transduction histidine kinase
LSDPSGRGIPAPAQGSTASAVHEAVIPPTGQGETLEQEWRRGALRATFLSLALALVPVSAVAFALDPRLGALLLASLPLNLLGARMIPAASPRRLRALAIALLSCLFLLTSAATLARGPTPLSAGAQTVFVIASGVLLGRRALWVAAALVGLGSVAIGAAIFSGLAVQPGTLQGFDWGQRAVWLRIAFGNGALIAVACAPVLRLLQQFERGALEYDRTLAQEEEERRRLAQAAQERSRSEEAFARAQRAQVVGTLGAAVAHGFNNGLVVIRGGAELLCSEDATPQERAQAAREIRDACRRATGLTRKLLSLARQEGHGGPRAQRDRADVKECFDEVARTFSQVLPADVRLVQRVQQERPGLAARLDASHLEQVLVNLALNARDAMPAGGTLTLTAGTCPAPPGAHSAGDGWLRLTVEDTGAGIPPEVHARLFEPFFTTKAAGAGAGLGLSTSKKIVEAAGGQIAVESAPGQGTCVEVLLPAAPREPATSAGGPARPPGSGTRRRPTSPRSVRAGARAPPARGPRRA